MTTTATQKVSDKDYQEFAAEYQNILSKESKNLLGTRTEQSKEELNSLIKSQVELVHEFVKKHGLKLVELNTAWVENSDFRRSYTYYGNGGNDFDSRRFKNLTDKEFVAKFNKGNKDTLFIKSNFWGAEFMCII